MKRFAFYDKGQLTAIIEAADCWQALDQYINKFQRPFDCNPSFRQLPPPARVIAMDAKRDLKHFKQQHAGMQ